MTKEEFKNYWLECCRRIEIIFDEYLQSNMLTEEEIIEFRWKLHYGYYESFQECIGKEYGDKVFNTVLNKTKVGEKIKNYDKNNTD